MLFAADPELYVPLQSGWHWLFTPIKGAVSEYGWDQVSSLPWVIRLSTYDFLDLRVLLLDIVILAALLLVVPAWLVRCRRRPWAIFSAIAGLLFGLAISLESYLSPDSLGIKVPLLAATTSIVLFIISLRVVKRYN